MAKKQAVNGERGRWSAKAKREAVLRLLRGEAIDTLSRELKVTAAKLSEWHLAERRRVRIDLGDGHATKARVVARPEQDEAVQGLAVQGAIAGRRHRPAEDVAGVGRLPADSRTAPPPVYTQRVASTDASAIVDSAQRTVFESKLPVARWCKPGKQAKSGMLVIETTSTCDLERHNARYDEGRRR